jgi:hypothetical protein
MVIGISSLKRQHNHRQYKNKVNVYSNCVWLLAIKVEFPGCTGPGIFVAIYFDESRGHFWLFWWVPSLQELNVKFKTLASPNWKCRVQDSSKPVARISEVIHCSKDKNNQNLYFLSYQFFHKYVFISFS